MARVRPPRRARPRRSRFAGTEPRVARWPAACYRRGPRVPAARRRAARSDGPMASTTAWATLLAVTLGLSTGVGVFTFHYGEGWSYFSRDPAACMNCHIMQSEYESWSKGGHHAV